MGEKKKLTEKERLERELNNTKEILKSGRRLKPALSEKGVKIDKTERIALQNKRKRLEKKLDTLAKRNDLGLALSGEIEDPGTVTDTGSGLQGGRELEPTSKPKTTSKPTSISPDNEVPKRFSEASGRKAIRDVLGDDTLVEYEDMSEAANFKKGGSVKKTEKSRYGMRSGGFTKRGGIYKKGAA